MIKLVKRLHLHHICWFVFTLLLASCSSVRTSTTETNTEIDSLAGVLPLAVPETTAAGSLVPVTVGPVDAPDGITVALMAVGSYGPHFFQTTLERGVASFELPPEVTRQSGDVTLVATAGEAHGTGELTILPGPPAEPLVPLVGPRSIVANGNDSSMVVVVPFDAFGNPIAEGTSLIMRALHPGDRLEEEQLTVEHLLAWDWITSGTQAGRTTIAVRANEAYGPEEELREVADWPIPFRLAAEPQSLPANGQDLMTLRTDVIRDEFGNEMPDGTLVTFVVEASGDEPSVIPAYTMGGQAEAQLQALLDPGVATVRAVVYSVESEPLNIMFTAGPAVGRFPVTADVNAQNGGVVLTAGPLLAQLDQFVPDGTPIHFSVAGSDGQQFDLTGSTENGYSVVELRLAELSPGTYVVRASAGSGQGSVTFTIPED